MAQPEEKRVLSYLIKIVYLCQHGYKSWIKIGKSSGSSVQKDIAVQKTKYITSLKKKKQEWHFFQIG